MEFLIAILYFSPAYDFSFLLSMYSQGQKNVKEALKATREREVDPHQAAETEPEYCLIFTKHWSCMKYFPMFLDKEGY